MFKGIYTIYNRNMYYYIIFDGFLQYIPHFKHFSAMHFKYVFKGN